MSGVVPALRFPGFEGEWVGSRFSSVAQLQSGYAFSSELFCDEGSLLVIPKNFSKNGRGKFAAAFCKRTTEKVDKKFQCKSGDLLVLLTDLNPSCELLGRPLLLTKDDEPVLLNQRIAQIEVEESLARKDLILQFMQTAAFLLRIRETATGSTVRHTSNKTILSTHLFLPSLPEQTKIAAFLGVVDAKLAGLQRKKGGLEAFKYGLMQQPFAQTLRFTRDDGQPFPDWEEKALSDVAPLQRGFDLPNEKIEPGSVPIVYSNGILKHHNEARTNGPGVVTGRSGTIGKVHYIEEAFWPHNTSLWVALSYSPSLGQDLA